MESHIISKIECTIQDSKEVSKLLQVWESSQPLVQTPLTREDKLKKSATDLVETETDYVMVS